MANLKHWLWLSERQGLTPILRQQVLERFGTVENIYVADEEACRQIEGLPPRALQSLADKSWDGVDRILGNCDRLGIHIMTLQDAHYPDRLRAIHQPPVVLYWKGRELAADEEAIIGMVGTRSSTPYGERMAAELAMDLTRAGALIVSGIAEGIDASAVRAALKAGGPVVSVLGGGIDVVYPKFHRDLFEDVAAAGTLISEYPPGTPTKAANFPVRNRIISGLSVGVVVVESPRIGGSLLTADQALQQNRELFAVPGPADAPASVGTNRLIQEGAAKLVMDAEDILCEFEERFPNRFRRGRPLSARARSQRLQEQSPRRSKPLKPEVPAEPAGEKEVDNCADIAYIDWKDCKDVLTDDQRQVLRSLAEAPLLVDDIVERTQIPARRVLSALTMLQIDSLVNEESGKRFRALVRNFEE